MKKILVLIVAISVVFCSSVGFAEKDPVVGVWYMLFDFTEYPELKEMSEGHDFVFSALFFLDNGVIVELDNPVDGNDFADEIKTTGHWEKTDDGYSFRLLGYGEGTFSVDGDNLLFSIPETEFAMRLRRAEIFNPYKDYLK